MDTPRFRPKMLSSKLNHREINSYQTIFTMIIDSMFQKKWKK